jgi:geranylgeranyl diphosphate synthase type I
MSTIFEEFLIGHYQEFDAYLATYLDVEPTHPDMMRYLYGPLGRYSANGGKRHRPLICLLSCKAVGGDPLMARSAAAAIENFHTAALIHDDIADDAKLRRGEPCLHITQGEGLAINAGDLALSLVNGTVVNDPLLSDTLKVRVVQELVAMTTRTVEGQALDIGWAQDDRFDLTVDDYLAMARHKTAYYSGAVPLAVGAIVGGGTDEQISALRHYGMSTGLAFQIQDDLLNLMGTEEATKKDFRGDITEGKRTLVVVHALEHSAHADELVDILRSGTSDPVELSRAVAIMQDAGSIDFAHRYALDLVEDAKARLAAHLDGNESRSLLLSMADFFISRNS